MIELESKDLFGIGDKPLTMHKDLKKLAVQMSGVLFHLIGMIKEQQVDIYSLRIFGCLISDTKIEFCVSRPVVDDNGKFEIIFESNTNYLGLDLLNGLVGTVQEADNSIIEGEVEDEHLELNVVIEGEEEDTESDSTGNEFDYSRSLGTPNLKALTNFVGTVHDYYSGLTELLLDIHNNPDTDPRLVYPNKVHTMLHTSGGATPQLSQTIIARLDREPRLISFTQPSR
jgi:hypothetical protein